MHVKSGSSTPYSIHTPRIASRSLCHSLRREEETRGGPATPLRQRLEPSPPLPQPPLPPPPPQHGDAGNAVAKMRRHGRRRRGQDLPAHILHDQRLPRRVHPDGLRQLLGESDGGQQAHQPGPLGYRGAGRLRPPAALELPADGRVFDLFLHREPVVF